MTTHELKTWPEQFEAVRTGLKTAEIRRTHDRTFAVGDILHLREFDPKAKGGFTGRGLTRSVSHITGEPWLPKGIVMLSLALCGVADDSP